MKVSSSTPLFPEHSAKMLVYLARVVLFFFVLLVHLARVVLFCFVGAYVGTSNYVTKAACMILI